MREVRSQAFVAVGILAMLAPVTFALDTGKEVTQYHQDFWSEEDGVPQASVQSITQARNGYIWIGTRDGLARFDGLKFTVYRGSDHPGLRSDDIRSLHEDNLGRLWIGTFNGGVSCLENGVFRAYSAEHGLDTTGVLEILQDSYGNLWFGTWGGIARFNRGRFETYREDEGVVGKNGWSFFEDRESSTLWAATDRAVHRFVESGFEVDLRIRGLDDIRKIHVDGNGVFWVGTLNGLLAYENGRARTFTTAHGLADNRIQTLAEDPDGNLWVGTWDGLSRIQKDQISSFPKGGERINGIIDALFVDRDGSLWIGMRGGGLARLRDAKFSNLTVREGLRSKIPRCVFEAADRSIWIGSDGGGIARVEGTTIEHFTRTNGLPSEFVASLTQDSQGIIWAGLGRPPAVAGIRAGKIVQIFDAEDGLPFEYSVRAVFVDRADQLWAGGDGGLCRIKAGKVTRIAGLPEGPVRVVSQDRAGRIWVGSSGGLCTIENDRVASFFGREAGLSHPAVYSFHEDTDGTIWLGTQQGLSRLKGGIFKPLTREQGGFQGTIYQLLEDDLGTMWMATSRGISTIKKNELNDVLDGAKPQVEVTTYSTADGLESAQCIGGSQSPGIKTRDGRLLFATLNGIAVTRPTDRDPHVGAPPVLIESVKADRSDFHPFVQNRFVAGTENFEFGYTAIRFITPQKVRFRYRLVGRDAAWIAAGDRRTAYYNSLRPGKYRFQVVASSDGVIWSEPAETAEFLLKPYFYQTRWFFLACGAVPFAFGLALHRYRIAKERERFAMILAERTRIARDLHDTMAQGFAGTAFQLEALRSNLSEAPERIKRHLDLALTMVRHSFSEAKRAVLNLRSSILEETDLVGAVRETGRQMLAESGVILDVKTTGRVKRFDAETEAELLRICQEALANALKHSDATHIEVSFDFSQRSPEVLIKDNGSGFELEKARASDGLHFGICGMSERVKQLGGSLEIRTAPGEGTEVKVHLN